MPEPIVSRSDMALAERTIVEGWDFSREEPEEIKRCVMNGVRHPKSWRYRMRAVAMQSQNIKFHLHEEEKAPPPGGVLGTVVHAHVTVDPTAFAQFLENSRPEPVEPPRQVIDGTSEPTT